VRKEARKRRVFIPNRYSEEEKIFFLKKTFRTTKEQQKTLLSILYVGG
jgi:hypothetical protein